jgi:hypothetical protein
MNQTNPRLLRLWQIVGDPKKNLPPLIPISKSSWGAGAGEMTVFLSRLELQTLTGHKQSAGQTRWLRRQGFHFRVDAVGHVVVLETEVQGKMATPQPDWGSL